MQVVEEEKDDTLGLKLQVFLLLTYFPKRYQPKARVCKVRNGTATTFFLYCFSPMPGMLLVTAFKAVLKTSHSEMSHIVFHSCVVADW